MAGYIFTCQKCQCHERQLLRHIPDLRMPKDMTVKALCTSGGHCAPRSLSAQVTEHKCVMHWGSRPNARIAAASFEKPTTCWGPGAQKGVYMRAPTTAREREILCAGAWVKVWMVPAMLLQLFCKSEIISKQGLLILKMNRTSVVLFIPEGKFCFWLLMKSRLSSEDTDIKKQFSFSQILKNTRELYASLWLLWAFLWSKQPCALNSVSINWKENKKAWEKCIALVSLNNTSWNSVTVPLCIYQTLRKTKSLLLPMWKKGQVYMTSGLIGIELLV